MNGEVNHRKTYSLQEWRTGPSSERLYKFPCCSDLSLCTVIQGGAYRDYGIIYGCIHTWPKSRKLPNSGRKINYLTSFWRMGVICLPTRCPTIRWFAHSDGRRQTKVKRTNWGKYSTIRFLSARATRMEAVYSWPPTGSGQSYGGARCSPYL